MDEQTTCRTHVHSRSQPHLEVKGQVSKFRVRPISFQPFEEFWNNLTQMLTIVRRCDDVMMWRCDDVMMWRAKVSVMSFQGQGHTWNKSVQMFDYNTGNVCDIGIALSGTSMQKGFNLRIIYDGEWSRLNLPAKIILYEVAYWHSGNLLPVE